MANETLKTLENALKMYYLGTVTKQLDEGPGPVFAALEKGSKYIVGNKFRFPLQYGRSGGVGARAEDDNLPSPSARKWAQGEATTKNLYARLSLSDKLLKVSKDNAASFVDQITEQMNNLVTDGTDMLARNLMGNQQGIMGQVKAGVTGAATITLKEGFSIHAFYPGQRLDCGTISGAAFTKTVNGVEVKDVDYAARTITFVSAVTCATDNYIILAGNFGNELTGLDDVFSAGTLYGIDRSANKWYSPVTQNVATGGTPAAMDSMFMQRAIDDIHARTGEKPDMMACSYGVQRAYIDEQSAYKRNLEYMTVDGGYDLVSYAKVPISPEKYAPAGQLYLLNTKHLYLGRLSDWDWMDEDGAILSRVPNKAAYEANLVMYGELLCLKPAANARITGIAEV